MKTFLTHIQEEKRIKPRTIGGTGKFPSGFELPKTGWETGFGRATGGDRKRMDLPVELQGRGKEPEYELPLSKSLEPIAADPETTNRIKLVRQIILGNPVDVPALRGGSEYDPYSDPHSQIGGKRPEPETETPETPETPTSTPGEPPSARGRFAGEKEGNWVWHGPPGSTRSGWKQAPWDKAAQDSFWAQDSTKESVNHRKELIQNALCEQAPLEATANIASALTQFLKGAGKWGQRGLTTYLIADIFGFNPFSKEGQEFIRQSMPKGGAKPKGTSAKPKALEPIAGQELAGELRHKDVRGKVRDILTGRRTKQRDIISKKLSGGSY